MSDMVCDFVSSYISIYLMYQIYLIIIVDMALLLLWLHTEFLGLA